MKKNLAFKIFALISAIFIWFQINLLREQKTVLNMPVRIINVPDNLYLYKHSNLKIPVNVKGRGIHIVLFYLSSPSIDYNGQDIKLGNNLLDIKRLENSLPYHPHLSLSPHQSESEIVLTTDRMLQKEVPVQFSFNTNRDKEFLQSERYNLDNVSVQVMGPSLEIQKIESVFTEKLGSDIAKSKRRSIRIKPVNEHIVVIPPSVELQKITDIISTKTLSSLPIYYNDVKYSIFPERVSVKIEGKLDSLSLVKAEDISAFILDEDYQDNSMVNVFFKKPSFIKILDYTPKTVRVSVDSLK